ncbi:type II secretion system protein [Salinibacterium sp. SWN139]|uniref:type IV pilus modification PilV family protein n=1 Tax=Salinibacterium sp. SWN139 TaxID=2792055 RepID=UPI0018CE2270|nr:type II secretion system protein [Salinibacterium sp. SWN139]MBH0053265.1 type II secretion system protein [Salinibacterium sp. SWN139]
MHKVLQRLRSSDAGMSLLEVLVAMMIFAIVSLGVLQSLTTVLTVTRDNRARIVAANLASQEIDLARDAGDVFTLGDDSYVKTLNGDDFTVTRSTQWVDSENTGASCGTGGGTLQYKQINIEVSWTNMRTGTEPVRFDTLLAPNDRINDPGLGTILVSVTGGSGAGAAGVSVTATRASPANGAQNLTVAPPATDAQGCTYILKVAPGNYDVSVSRSGYISDDGQSTVPSQLTQVQAGTASSVSFNYDDSADFDVNYVSNPVPSDVQIPRDMTTSFSSSYGVHLSDSTNSSLTRDIDLFPWRSGYVGYAGTYIPKPESATSTEPYCASRNPQDWDDIAVDGVTYSSPVPEAVAAEPGGNAEMTVPMGLVAVSGLAGRALRATAVAPTVAPATVNGDPGCTTGEQLVISSIRSDTTHIALPYGTWELERWNGLGGWVPLSSGSLVSLLLGTSTPSSGIVTVDPRVAP